jgi:hypothetical protein
MEFWNKLSEALKQKGFSTVQINKLQEAFGDLDAAGLLRLSLDQLLPAMTGRTVREKQEKMETLRAVVREIDEGSRNGQPDAGMRRIHLDETRLGEMINRAREQLVRAEVQSVSDLRRIARQPLDELRRFGFDEQMHKTFASFDALARVFPTEIAAALLEAGADELSVLLQWPRERFAEALYRMDLSPERVTFEYSRLQHLQAMSQQGSDIRKLGGLDIDLGEAFQLTASERQALTQQRVETLVDWGTMRDKVELSPATKERLDSYARLYAVGVRGDAAFRLIEEGLTSAAALARMSAKQIEDVAARRGIPTRELLAVVHNAGEPARRAAHLVEGTFAAIPGTFPDRWVDIMRPGAKMCIECAEQNSAFSRFAYYVYLVQRTGKALDEVQDALAQRGVATDLKWLSPVSGAELRDDPLNHCSRISLLDLIIRHLQEYLDHLRVHGFSVENRRSYVYLPYSAWRGERMGFYYPELNAIWRDDILTSRVPQESRGSIILDRARDRQVLSAQLEGARNALAQAKILSGSTLTNFSSSTQYQDFLRGLAVIEGVLGVDDLVQSATVQLDQDQAGVALDELRKALIELDHVCAEVFPLDTAWRIEGMSFEEYYTTLVEVPPPKRKAHLERAFDELMAGRKRIFEPLKPSSITGLRNDGSIDLTAGHAWAVDSGWDETAVGFRIERESGGKAVRYLRYKYETEIEDDPATQHDALTNYAVHFDFEVEDGAFPSAGNPLGQDVGIMIIARRQTVAASQGGGYRLSIKRKALGDPDSEMPRDYDYLVLEKFAGGPNDQGTLLAEVEVGYSGYIDIEGRTIKLGHVYRLSLTVDGSTVVGKLRKTAASVFEVAADEGDFAQGAFAIGVHRDLSVAFSQFEFVGAVEKGLVPFYAKRRELGAHLAEMSLDEQVYQKHVGDGQGMSTRLTELPLVLPANDKTEVSLAGTALKLVFSAGTHWVNNEALDLLLEKCLASLFFLRYAVIPTRTAQALAQRGDPARALQLLSLLYDDSAPGNGNTRQIYPRFAAPPDSLTPSRSLSPDVRLLRLRIGGICLEWADVLFRQNTGESRHQARRLYERVLALHDNASCDCDAQIGAVTEIILDRWLHQGFPTPPPDLDEPGRWDLLDLGQWANWNELTPEKARDLLDGAADPGNIDPPRDFYNGVEAILDFVKQEEVAYLDQVHTNIRYEELLNRGGSLMAHAEMDAPARTGLDAMLLEAHGRPAGRMLSPRSGGWQQRQKRGWASGGDNMVWSYREFELPAFCVPPDSMRTQQVKTACLNLELLDRCLNILGFTDSLVPPLRFEALLRNARNLADQAHALERDLFQTRQSFEHHSLSLQEAESNVALSEGDLAVEQLNKDLAQGGVQLTLLQARQTGFIKDHYTNLIEEGLSESEKAALQLLLISAGFQTLSAGFSFGQAIYQISSGESPLGSLAGGFGSAASVAGTMSSAYSMQASFERREQEWKFLETQGAFNELAAAAGVEQAIKHVQIAERRQQIAKLKLEFATDAVQFLSHKFLNREMWIWLHSGSSTERG